MALTLAELRSKFAAREKSVTIVTGGGLLAEHEAATEALQAAAMAPRESIADDGGVRDLAAAVRDLEERIADSVVTIRVRGLGRNAFRRLIADHTPEGAQSFDTTTFPPALVAACSLDPVLTASEAIELADLLTDGQWDQVFSAAWDACTEVDDLPKSGLASTLTAV